ncbi:chromatin accessibility complex protein 1 [Hyla sarda]|uniref:chromatin accessibility complex protein 1 n=1 Tax=Hyla sarda TaxID=327740 RepID=UPI0024C29443|nr:chromatin accessibility complex protein 1 [Hyla sarda]
MAGNESRLVSLPLSRIKVIMKSSPDVSSINQDALLITAKATELFVKYLASYSYKHGSGIETKTLTYDDLSHTAEESETFQFLSDILPKKILASEYLKMLAKEEEGIHDDLEDDDDDDEEEEDEDDDEEEEEAEEDEEEEEETDDSDTEDKDYQQDENDEEDDE